MELKVSYNASAMIMGPYANAPWSLEKTIRFTCECGYDGIEISGIRPHLHHVDYQTETSRVEAANLISESGLGVSGYTPNLNSTPPTETDENVYLDQIKKCLDIASYFKAPNVRIDTVLPPCEIPHDEYERKIERLITVWGRASELAAEYGIDLVWEYEPGFWLNKPSEILRVIRTVDNARLRLLFDSCHAYMTGVYCARQPGEPEKLAGGFGELVEKQVSYIGHIHLIDSDGTLHDDETSRHIPFGEGKIDFKVLLNDLKPALEKLQWITVDYCFHVLTGSQGKDAADFVRARIKEL